MPFKLEPLASKSQVDEIKRERVNTGHSILFDFSSVVLTPVSLSALRPVKSIELHVTGVKKTAQTDFKPQQYSRSLSKSTLFGQLCLKINTLTLIEDTVLLPVVVYPFETNACLRSASRWIAVVYPRCGVYIIIRVNSSITDVGDKVNKTPTPYRQQRYLAKYLMLIVT